jgi:hypothetical protein
LEIVILKKIPVKQTQSVLELKRENNLKSFKQVPGRMLRKKQTLNGFAIVAQHLIKGQAQQ